MTEQTPLWRGAPNAWERLLDWLGYQIVMHAPHQIDERGPLGRLYWWALPHAGNWAYRDYDFGDEK